MVFRESRVVDEVWAGVAPRALAGEALLIVLDNFEHDVVVASHAAWNNAALGDTNVRSRQHCVSRLSS